MLTLRTIEQKHSVLGETVIKILAQNHIKTLVDFLNTDIEKLCVITKLSLPQVLAARNHIFETYSAPLNTGTTLLNKYANRNNVLPMGIDSLDVILNGGLPIGYISEICGLSGSGKTQLCLQLAVNCVKETASTVLYIDTKGDFSAVRVQKILDSYNLTHKKLAELMFKIKVAHIWTMEELIEIVQKVKNKSLHFNQLSLIIIDSLPSLMFQHLGDNTKIGLALFNTFVNYCRYLCNHLDIVILCVNVQTRWIDQDAFELEDDKEQSTSTNRESIHIEKQNRCLGKYWQSIPVLVLTLEKSDQDSNNSSQINVSITNTSTTVMKQCILKVNETGVNDELLLS